LGATLLYEIHPWVQDEAERRELRQRATEHLMAAARLGAGPPWLALSNATRLGRLGELEQAARHLEEMHASVQDPALRAEIEGRIAELRSQASAAAMAHELAELEASRRRAYPWLPLDFFVLIGERPVVDEWALYESLGAPPRPASLEGPAAAEPAPSAPSTPDAAASGASSLEGRPED
ncbi:MAG: hypothetical protein OEY14_05300, partial [Myxococcales bacterium]|nr:hypothetical protein [Myxococcales bacterium]